jgi:hypothetical protein
MPKESFSPLTFGLGLSSVEEIYLLRKVVPFVCHVEISQTTGPPCHALNTIGKLLMSRGALRWFILEPVEQAILVY